MHAHKDTMTDYKLVLLETQDDYVEEGKRQEHALAHFYAHFQEKGILAYSLRKDGEPVLTLSVQPGKFTDHIVGYRNRPPTDDEFSILNPLLAARGIENRYDPGTIC